MAIDVVKGYTNYGKSNGNGFMDISANGARTAFKASTDFSKMPEPRPHDRPIALFMEGHTGLYAGGGMVIESTPPQVRLAPLKGRGWKSWGYIPDKWLSWKDGVIRTHEEVVAIAKTIVGMPYWYGTFGQAPSLDLLRAKRKQYPSQYRCIKSTGNYEGAINRFAVVMDCIGLIRYVCLAKRVKISNARPGESKPVPTDSPFAIGDRVRIKTNALHYYPGGIKIPDWLKGQVKTVDQVLRAGRADVRGGEQCILLGDGINSWISVKNVQKVKE